MPDLYREPEENPYQERHRQAEQILHYGDAPPSLINEMVDSEYHGMDPFDCPSCGGTMYYRATVGAYMCPTCNAMAHTNGELY